MRTLTARRFLLWASVAVGSAAATPGTCSAADWRLVTLRQISLQSFCDGSRHPCLVVSGGGLNDQAVFVVGADAATEERAFEIALAALGDGFRAVIDFQPSSACPGLYYTPTVVIQAVGVPGDPHHLALAGAANPTAGAGGALTVTAINQYGKTATGYAGDKTLVFSGAAASPDPVTPPAVTDRNGTDVPFGSGTVLTFTDGRATAALTLYKAGPAVVQADDGSLSTGSDPGRALAVTVGPAAASRLRWSPPPVTPVTTGLTWPAFGVETADPWGNRTADTGEVTLTPSAGTLGGTPVRTATAGLAVFDDLSFAAAPADLTVTATFGALTPADAGVVVKTLDPAVADFNFDDVSDVLWRNDTSGALSGWLLAPAGVTGSFFAGSAPGPDWRVAGLGDIDGDGRADILWQSGTTGDLVLWFESASGCLGDTWLGAVGSDWQIGGLSDADGDGRADLYWRHVPSGTVSLWLLDGNGYRAPGNIGRVDSTDWKVTGVADFDADRKGDLLWRYAPTGELSVWYVDETGYRGGLGLGTVDPAWKVIGLGDADGDGRADLFWRHENTGDLSLWFMDAAGVKGAGYLGGIADPDWQVAGIGDFDGDRRSDVLWRHAPAGALGVWYVDAGGYAGSASLGTVDPAWKTQNHALFAGGQ
ncbi:MAG: VCBS repeat-containing protein [Acidobacteria bacterium]|nr:VCBS repeat-containing protein [Acidobacteriota bacterium]